MVTSPTPFISAVAGCFACSPPAFPKQHRGLFAFPLEPGWVGRTSLARAGGQAVSCPGARDPVVDEVAITGQGCSVTQGCSSASPISWKSTCLV